MTPPLTEEELTYWASRAIDAKDGGAVDVLISGENLFRLVADLRAARSEAVNAKRACLEMEDRLLRMEGELRAARANLERVRLENVNTLVRLELARVGRERAESIACAAALEHGRTLGAVNRRFDECACCWECGCDDTPVIDAVRFAEAATSTEGTPSDE